MALAAATVAVVVGTTVGWRYALLAGWDAAALTFAVSAWIPIGRYDAKRTAAHACREEPGRAALTVIVVSAAVASLAAVGVLIGQASSSKGASQDAVAGFAVASVAVTWFAVHTLFTLRYAQLYFTGVEGGVDFNQNVPPRYLDFAYLAFTIGMTFQVSDNELQTPAIRATVLRHALLSYLLGAVVLASTINLIAGLGSGGG